MDEARKKILLTPIPPKTELKLRWEATINRIYWSLSLHNESITKAEVIKIISSGGDIKKKLSIPAQEILNYKRALDFISQNWLVSPKRITVDTIEELYEIACKPTAKEKGSMASASKESLKYFLDYIQTGADHPAIQAGMAQMRIVSLLPFKEGNGRISRLLSLLFLYKYGYDLRGLLVMSDYWRHDIKGVNYATELATKNKNFTIWLEFFIQAMMTQMEKISQSISSANSQTDQPSSIWEISDRQKTIMAYLEQPNTNITNKKVQKMFKISQITASRDLTKLTTLGLLFSHGKGRSVHYTRV